MAAKPVKKKPALQKTPPAQERQQTQETHGTGQVNWAELEREVALLSPKGLDGERHRMEPEKVLALAQHLAGIYRQHGKPLPDGLAVLI